MRKYFFLFLCCSFAVSLSAQMNIDGNTLYGNEWIDYSRNHIKISVNEDGIYKVDYQDLLANGMDANVAGSSLRMHHMGKEIPIHTSSNNQFTNADYILFYGEKNDGEMDKHLFADWETQQLNPRYSMFTETSAYYLSWGFPAQSSRRFRITENDLSGNLPNKEPYYIHTAELVFSNTVNSPPAPAENAANFSSFIQSEGFATPIRKNHNFTIGVANLIDSGPSAKLEFRTGSNGSTHIIDIEFNDKLLKRDNYGGNKVREYEFEIPLEDIKLSSTLKLSGQGSNFDNTAVAYTLLSYPRGLHAFSKNQFDFVLEANAFNKYFEVVGFDAGTENYLFDIENERVYTPQIEDNISKVYIPDGGSERSKLVLIQPDAFKTPIAYEAVSFPQFETLNPEYLILTSRELNNDVGGPNTVEEYAAFRSSELGGSYKTGIVDIEDIIEQFGYGVDDHSYSIRNFSNYVKDKWIDFEMVFIIGKGLSYIKKNADLPIEQLIPTYGNPGSDNLLFAEPELTYPYVAVGRLAALKKSDVSNYQRKVTAHAMLKDLENGSVEDRLWLKNIIHLSGGDIALQGLLFQHLSNMKDTIENNLFAGAVTTYKKTSTDPVQTSLSLDIIDRINEGAAILSFFGHSSAGTFDFSVEDPNDYENIGRNMIILSMGCHSGDIHEWLGTDGLSLSERMVMPELTSVMTGMVKLEMNFTVNLLVLV